MDIFTSINTAVGIANQLKKWSDTIQDLEIKVLVSNLLSEIADIKVECATLKTESIQYTDKIAELQKQLDIKKSIVFDDKRFKYGFYYSTEDAEKNQPYCPTCKEHSESLIHLTSQKPKRGGHYFECKVCKHSYIIEEPTKRSSVVF